MCVPAEGGEGWTFTSACAPLHPWMTDTALVALLDPPEPRLALPKLPLPPPQPARQSMTRSVMSDFSNDSLTSDFLQWTKTRQLSHWLCVEVSGVLHSSGCSLSVCPHARKVLSRFKAGRCPKEDPVYPP